MSRVAEFSFTGGLNMTAAPGSAAPGALLYCENFLCNPAGGYDRIAGFERFDGRTAPSSTTVPATVASLRAAIQEVPGEGPIRGVWVYNSKVYAFRNAVGGESCVMWESSSGGWVSKKTGLTPGGTYRFVNFNFKGSASSAMMYGVSGVHKAFQWDGATWTDITTGMSSDTPKYVEAHKNYLWLGFANGSLQNSPLGDPTGTWTPRTGANEIGLGDEITNIVSHKDVLVCYAHNSIFTLSGSANTGSDPWILRPYLRSGGARADTAREIGGDILAWDNLGAVQLSAVQAYGNFSTSAVSDVIRPLAKNLTQLFSQVSKRTGSYRAYSTGGRVLVASFVGNKPIGWTQLNYGKNFVCGGAGEDASGGEMLMVGGDDGFVYQLDKGTSFDGANIVAVLRTTFNTLKSPTQKKRMRRLLLDITATSPINLKVQPDFDYGDFGGNTAAFAFDMYPTGGGGIYDVANWDSLVWDGGVAGKASATVDGVGVNVGFLFNHTSAVEQPFTIAAGYLHFDLWGQQR